MRFLHLSDIHFRENYQTNLFTAELFPTIKNPQLALEKLLQELSLTVYDFILLTGDLVHEGGFLIIKSYGKCWINISQPHLTILSWES